MWAVGAAFAQTAHAGTGDEVAPGVKLTSDALVWVLEGRADGMHALPLSHRDASIVNNVGTNFARSVAWMKQKKAAVIPGDKADVRIHNGDTALYVQLTEAEEKEAARSEHKLGYAIVKVVPDGPQRFVGHFEFSRFKGVPTFRQTIVETTQSRVPNTQWLRVTPEKPLPPGEYGLVQLTQRTDTYSTWVFDFGVDVDPRK